MSTNVIFSKSLVTTLHRESLLNQRGCVLWFTGLPGSGKSTIAALLEKKLISAGHLAFVLDGDNLRHGLCSDLNFSEADRHENIRRASEVAKLFADACFITITSFISPYLADRNLARATIGENRFIETFIKTPVSICEERDPKGHWKKARAGKIKNFTGIDAPFEEPMLPQLTLNTIEMNSEECANMAISRIHEFLVRPASK